MKTIEDPMKSNRNESLNNKALTPLYDKWVNDLLGVSLEKELEATCDDCIMLAKNEEDVSKQELFFSPLTKCCTYYPSLPNYLVGLLLLDEDENQKIGQQLVSKIISQKENILPLGVLRPKEYNFASKGDLSEDFGVNRDLLCPYYQNSNKGFCSIWKYRTSICQTWFCKHKRGMKGFRFWKALKILLESIEKKLSTYCALDLDLGANSYLYNYDVVTRIFEHQTPKKSGSKINYQLAWGRWYGKEMEFFESCGELVRKLSWSDLLGKLGVDLRVYENAVKVSFDQLNSTDIPVYLKPNDLVVDEFSDGFVGLRTYSAYDPVDIPLRIFRVIHYFNDHSVFEAVQMIQEKEGISLSHDDIHLLMDFNVLIPRQ